MDLQIFRAINLGWQSPFCDYVFGLLSFTGLGSFSALVAILLVFRKQTRIYAFSIGLAAFMGGTVLAQSFKSFIPRDRPSNLTFAIVQEQIYKSSFPSGHTATAFAVATAISILALRKERWGIVLMAAIWATGVGLSRIYRGVHWPTDVFGGALAGILGGCLTILIIDAVIKQRTKKVAA